MDHAAMINRSICRISFLLFLILPALVCGAQSAIRRKDVLADYVFSGNHFQLYTAHLSVSKARLKRETGTYNAGSGATSGMAIGFRYQINFNTKYSLLTGPEFGLLTRDFFVFFKKEAFSPPLAADYNSRDINYNFPVIILSLPVLLEKRWEYKHSGYLYAGAGIRFNVSTGYDLDATSYRVQTGNQFYEAAGLDVSTNNDAKPWFSFPLLAGHSWVLKNFNIIGVGLLADVSFTPYVDGRYRIDIPSQPLTEGHYSSTGTYWGLSIRYNFTGTNYRLRKVLEKKNP